MSGHTWRDGAHGRRQRIAGGRLAALLLGLALALAMAACGGSGGGDGTAGNASTVYGATPVEPGSECPYGGVRIDYGIDENGNGVLDSAEVDGSSVVCNGAGAQGSPVTPPAGPAAQYTFALNGGEGTSGYGGDGGWLELSLSPSGGTGHIKLFQTGVADASFTFPATVSTYLGAVPLVVPAEAQLEVAAYDDPVSVPHSGLAAGEIHTHIGNSLIFVANTAGNGDEAGKVTGIWVGAGATLTFEHNVGTTTASISVANDVRNEGTITVVNDELNPSYGGWLTLECDLFYGAPGSQIELAGDQSGGAGGDGGHLEITAYSDLWDVYPYTGAIYNAGTIDVSGADGTDGSPGSGGNVKLFGNLGVYNTGFIDASGGDGQGTGGTGGEIVLDGCKQSEGCSFTGGVNNSGDLAVHGGQGDTSGGEAGGVKLIARGDVRNAGNVLAWGGDSATGDGGDSNCGECSPIPYEVETYGGDIFSAGDVIAHGGASLTDGDSGGRGGIVQMRTHPYIDAAPNEPPGSIFVSGNIDLSGGRGTEGGGGGSFDANIDASDFPAGQEIQLLGYQSLSLDGGRGASYGGYAGSVSAYSAASLAVPEVLGGVQGPAGGVHNHVPIFARGGAGYNQGGPGGSVELLVDSTSGFQAPWQVAANFGAMDLSGGAGDLVNPSSGGGDSGALLIEGPSRAENHGALTVNGGVGYFQGGSPGAPQRGSGVVIRSGLGPAINTATIHADGGAFTDMGGGNGGNGNLVQIVGALAVQTGLVSVVGGSGPPDTEGLGGDGGQVYLFSTHGLSTATGGFAITGGTGGTDGADGVIHVDGINRSVDYLP